VIPSIRGRFRSRRIETLIEEAVRMAQTGCLELNIVAQDVTAYGIDLYGKKRLPDLLARLSEIDGLEWIRLFYCYEDKLTAELIECMRTLPKLCHYIDLPIQHINNRILRQMRRRSNRTTILGAIEKLRSAIPDIHIRTSLIAGFPGETEAEFEELADFIKETRFERLGVFAYSEEEGTPAAEMAQLPEEVRTERRDRLMEIQNRISYEQNQAKIGQQFDVLIEAEEAPGVFRGRTQYDAPEIDNEILFEADHRRSAAGFAKIRVTDAYDYDLIGREEESPGESTQ
jgi:ribosomal protein S12 methylthiotransferase